MSKHLKEKNSKMLKARKYNFVRLAEIIAFVLCTVAFYFLMLDVWNKFKLGVTTTGTRWADEGVSEKLLPCLTVCRKRGFRVKGWHVEEKDFIKQTFNQVYNGPIFKDAEN